MPSRRLSRVVLSVAAALSLLWTGSPAMVRAGVFGPTSTVAYEFDSAGSWKLGTGVAALSTVTSPKTSGTAALKVSYNLTTSSAFGIVPAGTPAELPGLPRRVSIDIYGDGSWNTIYYELHDMTGEILRYYMGNLSFTGWQTITLDLEAKTPISGLSGNGDQALDLPASFSRVVILRNGSQPASGTLYFDHMVYQYDPSPLTAGTPIFAPSAAQTSAVTVALTDLGTFNLRLVDEAGLTRTYSGSSGDGATWSTTWNGRNDSAQLMSGSVRALLAVTRGGKTETVQWPYFAGLTARVPGANAAQRGINSYITERDTSNRASAAAEVVQMEGAFVGMAREEFEWSHVEPAKGVFNWAKFDQAVELERAHGIAVLGKLVYGSPWDNTAPSGTSATAALKYPPSNLQNYVDYAVATVHRYKDRVHYWEIWNEENHVANWMPAVNVARYTQLLKLTYAAIKAEDPTATVVLGGLSTGADATFLAGIHDNGGWGSFDVLAIHSFVSGAPNGSAFERWTNSAQAIAASYGVKPIWITEFGWSSYTGSGSGYVGVSLSRQKVYLERAYEIATRDNVQGVFWFESKNRGNTASDKTQNYGVLYNNLTRKPAWDGLKCEAEALYGGDFPQCSSPAYPDSTFFGLPPTRIVDSRTPLGLSGALVSGTPRTFKVTGDLGGTLGTVVPTGAIAVTGNLTVTGSTSDGFVYLGPDSTTDPDSSTINFPAGDNRANGVTVPLDANGQLSAVFKGTGGKITHVLFDVTGYYVPGDTGDFFQPVTPARLLDSRDGTGNVVQFKTKVPQTFAVTGRVDDLGHVIIPADAVAVTGNFTITNQSARGYAYIGNVSSADPGSSSLNAPFGDNRANNVTVALDGTGSLSAVFVGPDGSTADLIFDVSGYFTRSGGLHYVPVVPTRLLDTRAVSQVGLVGPFVSHTPRGFTVEGVYPVPAGAMAVTGNLTVTRQQAGGFAFMAASAPAYPTASTLNFPVGDNRANGVTLVLSATGTLDIVYVAAAGKSTDFLFDVTGYFH
jgi:hypothetical protein